MLDAYSREHDEKMHAESWMIVFAGHELGFMLGAVYALKGEAAKDADLVTSKQLQIAGEVQGLIEQFPEGDMEGTEMQERLLKVRNRFKLLAASVPVIQKVRKPTAGPSFDF